MASLYYCAIVLSQICILSGLLVIIWSTCKALSRKVSSLLSTVQGTSYIPMAWTFFTNSGVTIDDSGLKTCGVKWMSDMSSSKLLPLLSVT